MTAAATQLAGELAEAGCPGNGKDRNRVARVLEANMIESLSTLWAMDEPNTWVNKERLRPPEVEFLVALIRKTKLACNRKRARCAYLIWVALG